jgi:predicted O-methyltransferase YrrM
VSTRTTQVTESVYEYLLGLVREPELLRRLREETARLPMSRMQIAPEQGQFMTLLVELMSARRYLELGVFTGYSTLSVGLALPSDGLIVACDLNEEWTGVARRYFEEAGIRHKLDLRLAPAHATLDALLESGADESFDLCFIDADKENYVSYYEKCLRLVRHGGLIAVDNALWGGAVASAAEDDEETASIRELNKLVAADDRVTQSLVPIGDGLLLARRR